MSRKNTRHIRMPAWFRRMLRRDHEETCKPTMAGLLRRYAKLRRKNSREVVNGFQMELPSGSLLTLYDTPVLHVEGMSLRILFGEIYYPDREFNNLQYLTKQAAHKLYKRLTEIVAELEGRK